MSKTTDIGIIKSFLVPNPITDSSRKRTQDSDVFKKPCKMPLIVFPGSFSRVRWAELTGQQAFNNVKLQLSKLFGREFNVHVPTFRILETQDLGDQDRVQIFVDDMRIARQVQGRADFAHSTEKSIFDYFI